MELCDFDKAALLCVGGAWVVRHVAGEFEGVARSEDFSGGAIDEEGADAEFSGCGWGGVEEGLLYCEGHEVRVVGLVGWHVG